LEWLEQGRSIVWGQLLQLRTPVDALHEVQPALANELVRVSMALEHESSLGAGRHNVAKQSDGETSWKDIAQEHHRLAEQWGLLVERARNTPGFEDFLQPKRLAQLHTAAESGPVVVVNICKIRCDALILLPGLDDVMHIPLKCFSYQQAQQMHLALNRLLLDSGVRARDTRGMRRVTVADNSFPSILSDLWSCVVKPVLDSVAINVGYL
jgi:hypothetical protein